jgi:hypothetical protein
LLESRRCFICDHKAELLKQLSDAHPSMTVISGRIYTPGNRTSGAFRGMAGRRFDIEYIAPSAYAGQKITTFDLWAGGKIPAQARDQYPDTARFLNGAGFEVIGETGYWDASHRKSERFLSPSSLRPTKSVA